MIKVTLDTNIIIKATKPHEVDHVLAIRLLELHKLGLITVQVVAANASEYSRSMVGEHRSLQADLDSLGFSQDDIRILPTIAIWGVTYYGHSYYATDEANNLRSRIWDVIYSSVPMEHKSFSEYQKTKPSAEYAENIDRRWRNYMCDVLTILEYVRDCQRIVDQTDICILVTADSDDIIRHRPELQELGAKQILGLNDALKEIEYLIAAKDT